MTANPSAQDRPATGASASLGPEFRKLFIVGVFGWALGMAALLGAAWIFSKPETVPIALLWMISHSWIAFFVGVAFMAGSGLLSKAPLAKPLLAYILPVALLAGIAGVCLMIYPDAGFRGDLFIYLPVVFVFYCFGCLWMTFAGMDDRAFLRAVLPSLAGGLVILGFVVVPAFTSNAFRYRAAFKLNSRETKIKDGTLVFDGDLEITKAGNYEFTAPRYIWIENPEDGGSADVELGEIHWGGAGAPKEGACGKFPLSIVWKKGVTPQVSGQVPPYEEYVSLEVHRPDQGGKIVYTISAQSESDL